MVDGKLVAGDTLFLEGCGRTDLPGSDPDAMYESLTQRLATVPDSTCSTRVISTRASRRRPWARRGNATTCFASATSTTGARSWAADGPLALRPGQGTSS